MDLDGTAHTSDEVRVTVSPRTTAIDEQGYVPSSFQVFPTYPNPFNPSTVVSYGLPQRAHVTIAVYNALGQEVARLANEEHEAGYHRVTFDASGLPSGTYVCRVQADQFVESRRLVLIR